MSNIKHLCHCLVLETPRRAPARRPALLSVIVLLFEAFEEAWAMHRAARQKYPFDNE
jgi:hypothetical protein